MATSSSVLHLAEASICGVSICGGEEKISPSPRSFYANRAWLQNQYVYTPHRPVKKRFDPHPHILTYVIGVRECYLMDV